MAAEPVRLVALRLLGMVLEGGGSSSYLIDRARFRNTADRALAMELLFGTLRRLAAIDFIISARSRRPLADLDPDVRNALRVGVHQIMFLSGIPDHAAVGETVEAAKIFAGHKSVGFVNGVLRAVLRDPPVLPDPSSGDAYLTTTLSLPPFLLERWRRRFGFEATASLAESAQRPPIIGLRILSQRTGREEILARLRAEGMTAEPGSYLSESVRVSSGFSVRSDVVGEGLAIVQDEAAQVVSHLAAPRPDDLVLDACAAPGGKAIAIADLGAGRVRVVAVDSHAGRLARARSAFVRTGVQVMPVAASAAALPFVASFDVILVDAPCTGTGTIRRNPEIRYRVDDAALARSAKRASSILDGVVDHLRPGGRLVYATCSLEPEENEAVIAALLARRSDFRRVDPRPLLPVAAHRLVTTEGTVRTQPEDLEIDGFTAIVLERST